jgi:hypothetical protein
MTEIKSLMLFTQTVALYCDKKTRNTFCGQNAKLHIIKEGGMYIYRRAL